MVPYLVPDNMNSCHYDLKSCSAAVHHQLHDIKLLTLLTLYQWFVILLKRKYFLGQHSVEDRVDFCAPLLVHTSMTI